MTAVIFSTSIPLVTGATDYREEIMFHVVDQCYAGIAMANEDVRYISCGVHQVRGAINFMDNK